MSLLRLFFLIIMLTTLSACATVNRGVEDHFRIDTVPQGAKVTIETRRLSQGALENREKRGKQSSLEKIICYATPCAIPLARRSTFVARIEHEGYEPAEIYISSGTKRGGGVSNMGANLAVNSGSGAYMGLWAAGFGNAFYEIFSFGLLQGPYSQSAAASSGAAVGLGVGAAAIATDVASGANLNLYPNPVVLALAPKGTPARIDPVVAPYRARQEAYKRRWKYCRSIRRRSHENHSAECEKARDDMRIADTTYKNLLRRIQEEETRIRKEVRAKAEAKP